MNESVGILPKKSTPYYASLSGLCEELQRQIEPDDRELFAQPYEMPDPLSENMHTVSPGLVHRYQNRVILKVTDECAVHCRFCFRKALIAEKRGALLESDLLLAAVYIAEHPEIAEVVLTGGDPLMLKDTQLQYVLTVLREKRPDIVFRINTRIPVVLPDRITEKTVKMLAAFSPLWVSIHTNHPGELTAQASGCISLLADNGIPLLSQTVLLKDINDKADTLEQLFSQLIRLRVKPYYLFQLDSASGTSHFRVTIEQGFEIMKELRLRLAGYALPVYALDLPGGGGKVPLTPDRIVGHEEGWIVLKDDAGKEYRYPE
ncbi:MAG: KamA family radical SAM protein [Spirochaetales bacterium]|nr:KamA family radical SAM protein [Spirochaetales bacterium]